MTTTEKAFEKCQISIYSNYRKFCQDIIELCEALNNDETDEALYYLGEAGEFCLMDLIVGAHFHFTHWHRGMTSLEYGALSATGSVFNPMHSTLDDQDISACFVYDTLNELAESHHRNPKG